MLLRIGKYIEKYLSKRYLWKQLYRHQKCISYHSWILPWLLHVHLHSTRRDGEEPGHPLLYRIHSQQQNTLIIDIWLFAILPSSALWIPWCNNFRIARTTYKGVLQNYQQRHTKGQDWHSPDDEATKGAARAWGRPPGMTSVHAAAAAAPGMSP